MSEDRGSDVRGAVHASISGGVGLIVFDNPRRRNALSLGMLRDTQQALARFDQDGLVGAIVLRGAGHVAFASGVDISEFAEREASDEARQVFDDAVEVVFDTLRGIGTPTISMISGYCLGGGLAIALGTDIRIASETSSFAIPASALGLGYPYTNTAALVSAVGPAAAAELLFSARRFLASEALATGLVNQVVAETGLERHVSELASTITQRAPLSVRAAKATIRAVMAGDADSRAAAESAIARCAGSEDLREGRLAFMQKRAPRFLGR